MSINTITKEELDRRKANSDLINQTEDLTFENKKTQSKQAKFYKKIRELKDNNEIERLKDLKPEDYFNHLLD